MLMAEFEGICTCIQVLAATAEHHARYWQLLGVGLPLHPIATQMFQD